MCPCINSCLKGHQNKKGNIHLVFFFISKHLNIVSYNLYTTCVGKQGGKLKSGMFQSDFVLSYVQLMWSHPQPRSQRPRFCKADFLPHVGQRSVIPPPLPRSHLPMSENMCECHDLVRAGTLAAPDVWRRATVQSVLQSTKEPPHPCALSPPLNHR